MTLDAYPGHRIATPTRAGRLVLQPSFREGDFDSHGVDCPFVFSVDGRQGMTYVGWDGVGYQTALSWKQDDETWSPGEVILHRDPSDPLRRYNTALTSIVRDNDLASAGALRTFDGWYLATFHAYPRPGYEEGAGTIGFLRSRDLRNWERVGGLLRPEDGEEWERGGLYKSWLMEHDGVFHVFYNAKNPDRHWTEQTGVATSRDLVTWQRSPSNPLLRAGAAGEFDERFASDPCVLRDHDMWIMFYFGLSADGHARESYATSPDLEHWTKSGELLLDVGPMGSIDSLHAHKPAVITWNGRLEHYYTAVSRGDGVVIGGAHHDEVRGISVATN